MSSRSRQRLFMSDDRGGGGRTSSAVITMITKKKKSRVATNEKKNCKKNASMPKIMNLVASDVPPWNEKKDDVDTEYVIKGRETDYENRETVSSCDGTKARQDDHKEVLTSDEVVAEEHNLDDSDDVEEEDDDEEEENENITCRSITTSVLPAGCPEGESHDLGESFQKWVRDAEALLSSEEMSSFAKSTRILFVTAADAAINVALLPVTVPVHAASSATSVVCRSVTGATSSVLEMGRRTIMTTREGATEQGPWDVMDMAWKVVPLLCNAVGKVKDDIVLTVLRTVAPVIGWVEDDNDDNDEDNCEDEGHLGRNRSEHYASCPGQSSAEYSSLTDRLRLDYPAENVNTGDAVEEGDRPLSQNRAENVRREPIKTSTSFLRVCDLDIYFSNEDQALTETGFEHRTLSRSCSQPIKLTFLELQHEPPNESIIIQALEALAWNGRILATNDDDYLDGTLDRKTRPYVPEWKPEKNTKKLLRKPPETQSDWISLLEREILIWSGRVDINLNDAGVSSGYGLGVPMFKARGIVNMSPRDFAHLLLDSDRVGEYNKYNIGRSDELVLQEGIDTIDGRFGAGETKVVRSETRVPFAGTSVVLQTLMHARRMDQIKGEGTTDAIISHGGGYIIISRSVKNGRVGEGAHALPNSKNEIIWGVNVLGSVEGHPSKTDLTSVSQVSSSLVPTFLTHKIGIMGVIDFFSTIRALSSQ